MKTNQHHFLFVECRYLNAEESLILSFPSFSNKLDCTWGDSVKMFTTGLSNSKSNNQITDFNLESTSEIRDILRM
jgi:hypothetical protein